MPLSQEIFFKSCLSCRAVPKFQVLFWTSGTFYGTKARFFGTPNMVLKTDPQPDDIMKEFGSQPWALHFIEAQLKSMCTVNF